MATKGDISDLDVLFYGGQPVVPLVEGFTRTRQGGVIRSDVSGGASRQRKKYYGTTHLAQATFYLRSPAMQDFIQLFINRNEGKRWICHLAADRPLVEPYVVQALTDWNHVEVNALRGSVTVQLEIFSARDECLDGIVYPLYQCIGDDLCEYLKMFGTMTEGWPQYMSPPPHQNQGVTLDFINQRYYKDQLSVAIDDVMTFTRASVGTDFVNSVLTTFSVNQPRVGDAGLLVEQQSSNLMRYSSLPQSSIDQYARKHQTFDFSATSEEIYFTANTSGTIRWCELTSTDSSYPPSVYTLSVFVKELPTYDGTYNVRVMNYDSTFGDQVVAEYNLAWGDLLGKNISITATTTKIGRLAIRLQGVNGNQCSVGDEFIITTPQIENTPFKTSHIKTNGVVDTRQPDYAKVNISDISRLDGTVFFEYCFDGRNEDRALFSIGDGSLNHFISCRNTIGGNLEIKLSESGVVVATLVVQTPIKGIVRIGLSYSQNKVTIAVNGQSLSTVPTGGVTSLNQIELGTNQTGEKPLNGHIRKTWYRPYTMTEQQLIEVTS